MPDRHHTAAGPTPPNPPNPPPAGWADAFAALPAETPPADGWARMAARLPAARAALEPAAAAASAAPRAAFHRRWALAAMLAAALPLGLWLGLRAQRPPTHNVAPALATQTAPAPNRDSAPAGVAPTGAAPSADANLAAADSAAPGVATGEPRAAPAASPGSSQERRTADIVTAPQPAAALDPPRRRAPRGAAAASAVASTGTAAPAASTASATSAYADATRLTAQLRELQAESSQLEALVAAARDDRVASAASAAMGAGLDQRLQLIDTALADAALPADTRVALWRERVDSLRSLAGMESSQRWYAARGERYDGALVRVD